VSNSDTKILPTAVSLSSNDLKVATPETIMSAVCHTTDNCNPYEDLDDPNKAYVVECRATASNTELISQSAKSVCSQPELVKLISGTVIAGCAATAGKVLISIATAGTLATAGVGAVPSAGAAVLASGAVATACIAVPAFLSGTKMVLTSGCLIYQKSTGSGLCIARPVGGTFCSFFDFLKPLVGDNSCIIGGIIVALILLIILLSAMSQ